MDAFLDVLSSGSSTTPARLTLRAIHPFGESDGTTTLTAQKCTREEAWACDDLTLHYSHLPLVLPDCVCGAVPYNELHWSFGGGAVGSWIKMEEPGCEEVRSCVETSSLSDRKWNGSVPEGRFQSLSLSRTDPCT